MASHSSQSSQPNIPYDALPRTNRAAEQYEMVNSPSPRFHTSDIDQRSQSSTPHPPNLDDLPPAPAAEPPRFYGLALRDDGPRPFNRDSYASSTGTSTPGDGRPYDLSSIHALNPTTDDISSQSYFRGAHYSPQHQGSPLMTEAYQDEPGFTPHDYPGFRPPHDRLLDEKRVLYTAPQQKSRKKGLLIGGVIAGILLVVVGVMIPIYFLIIRKHSAATQDNSSNPTHSGSSTAPGSQPSQVAIAVTGGDGSTVTTEDGSTFTYSNQFGGYWYWDEKDPLNNGARAQSWSPALNETFNYGVDKIRGVNLGGWLCTEPFIAPALYEKYVNSSTPAVDEWTLTQAMAANNALGDLEDHYKTFITEQDFAEIAGAGLNYVRIPLPYWAIEVRKGEPFLAQTSWTYFLKAIQWARKYGIRINLDLHAVPGSQNGWNHSGRYGDVNFLLGVAGMFNAQRTLEYIQVIAEFISQPQYRDVVTMFGVINEPRATPFIGQENLARWYMEAYNIVRNASGIGEGNGPFVSIHDGFVSPSDWQGIFPNADRMSLDTHPYIAFGGQSSSPPSAFVQQPCQYWGNKMNDSMASFGLTTAGEFSLAVNDCGLWVNGVFNGTRYEGTYPDPPPGAVGSCDQWNNWDKWNGSIKKGLMQFALTSMDALQNYFFWTWKIGNSTVTGKVEAPFWSYQLGLQNGWVPKDPRSALGACASQGVSGDAFQAPLSAWQTGGNGAGSIPSSAAAAYAWPPTAINSAGDATLLPQYTPTGVIPTLPVPTFTSATANVGNGWFNAQDTQGAYVSASGCSYPDPWGGLNVAVPTAPCPDPNNNNKRDASPQPGPTPPPSRS